MGKRKRQKRKERKKKKKRMEVPTEYECPITYNLMQDPVLVVTSGWTYDRKAITEWINEHGDDPMTKKKTSLEDLVPNRSLIDGIEQWKKRNDYEANDYE